MMDNTIEMLQEYVQDVYPVSHLNDLGPLSELVRSNGDKEFADLLVEFKLEMERLIYSEHNYRRKE